MRCDAGRVRGCLRVAFVLLTGSVACAQEAPWGPPKPVAPEWAEHVAAVPLGTGHYYLRFDAPPPRSADDIESFYASWLEPRAWMRTPEARGPASAQGWTPFVTEDGLEGEQRFVRWVDPSRKWSCRVGLFLWSNGSLSADVVIQPSGEIPIDAR